VDTAVDDCADAPVTAAPESCPPACTGGCDGDVCTLGCDGLNDCVNTALTCPPEMRCVVDASGINALVNGSVAGPATGATGASATSARAYRPGFSCASSA
jgi:hypothetical protein